jgi:DNA-binding MurR/RpiR family transcriptional regulator
MENVRRHPTALAATIGRHYSQLSPGHQKVADLILASPHQAALMNLEQMSQRVGLSKATVNRFGAALGLSGYKTHKRLLRSELEETLRPVEGLVRSLQPEALAGAAPWTRSLIEDSERVRTIRAVGGDAAFAGASQRLATARHVFVVGFGGSAYLAGYAAFCLSSLRGRCEAVTDAGGFEGASRKILDAGPDDAALCLGFARYTRDGLTLARRLHAGKTPLICITDGEQSPFASLATHCLLVKRKPGFVLSGPGAGGAAAIEALLQGTAAALGLAEIESRSARLTSALGEAITIDG